MANFAKQLDGIAVVQNTTDRGAQFPSPMVNQRVHRLDANAIERWTGSVWAIESLNTQPVFNVLDVLYGADPTNTAPSAAKVQLAVNAAAAAGGGIVAIPAGAYQWEQTVTHPSYVTIRCAGKDWVTLKRTGAFAFFSYQAANNQILTDCVMDGNGFAAPFWSFLDSNARYSEFRRIRATNYPASQTAVSMAQDSAPFSVWEDVKFEPTGTQTAVPCITLPTDTGPNYRRFINCDAMNGNPLFDAGASEMNWFVECSMLTLIFSSASAKKVNMVGCRVATTGITSTFKGVNHSVTGSQFAGPVVFDSTTTGCQYNGNVDAGVSNQGTGTGINANRINGHSQIQALAIAATINVDASIGSQIHILNINQAITIALPTNPSPGQLLHFLLGQDGTGGRAVTFASGYHHSFTNTGNVANSFTMISFRYTGSAWMQASGQSPYFT